MKLIMKKIKMMPLLAEVDTHLNKFLKDVMRQKYKEYMLGWTERRDQCTIGTRGYSIGFQMPRGMRYFQEIVHTEWSSSGP